LKHRGSKSFHEKLPCRPTAFMTNQFRKCYTKNMLLSGFWYLTHPTPSLASQLITSQLHGRKK